MIHLQLHRIFDATTVGIFDNEYLWIHVGGMSKWSLCR